jgi:hypothetical protein
MWALCTRSVVLALRAVQHPTLSRISRRSRAPRGTMPNVSPIKIGLYCCLSSRAERGTSMHRGTISDYIKEKAEERRTSMICGFSEFYCRRISSRAERGTSMHRGTTFDYIKEKAEERGTSMLCVFASFVSKKSPSTLTGT